MRDAGLAYAGAGCGIGGVFPGWPSNVATVVDAFEGISRVVDIVEDIPLALLEDIVSAVMVSSVSYSRILESQIDTT
jgi:hypothetical protein